MSSYFNDQTFNKRCRTRFNSWQIEKLEDIFLSKTHYPDSNEIEILANETGISIPKMQIWFQNRRAKWRKNSRLRNFGGLGRVTETEFVPAPNDRDTIKSFHVTGGQNDAVNYISTKYSPNEREAIDLSITAALKASAALKSYSYSSLYLMPSPMYDKSTAYITGHGESQFTNHMNAFEYIHGSPYASNHTMTSSYATVDSQSVASDRQKMRQEMSEKCDYN